MSLRTTPLHTRTRFRLLHVIVNNALAHADAYLPSARHCEPVQNGNRGAPVRPGEGDAAKRLKPWIFLRKSRGEGCAACIAEVWQSASPAQGVHCGNVLTNVATPPPSACHCEPVQNGNRGAPVRPGEGDAAERLKTWIFLRKSRGEGCAACIAEVWQSVLPAGKLGKLAAVWANS